MRSHTCCSAAAQAPQRRPASPFAVCFGVGGSGGARGVVVGGGREAWLVQSTEEGGGCDKGKQQRRGREPGLYYLSCRLAGSDPSWPNSNAPHTVPHTACFMPSPKWMDDARSRRHHHRRPTAPHQPTRPATPPQAAAAAPSAPSHNKAPHRQPTCHRACLVAAAPSSPPWGPPARQAKNNSHDSLRMGPTVGGFPPTAN